MFFMEKVLQIENWVNQDVFVCQHVSVKLKNHSCWIGTSYMPFQGSVFMVRCWLSIVALWSLGGGNLDSPPSGYCFSSFWLRSKCSICSYQLNIWYGRHALPSILNWFLQEDRVQELAPALSWVGLVLQYHQDRPTEPHSQPWISLCVQCNWACLLPSNIQQTLVEHIGQPGRIMISAESFAYLLTRG